MTELPKVKDLPDYEHRKWLAQNILGLDEPPELNPDAIYRLDGLFSDLVGDEPMDVVALVKEARE